MTAEPFAVVPVAVVVNDRDDPGESDHWDNVMSTIVVDERFPADCFQGLEEFSHVEVVFVFDRATERPDYAAQSPRGDSDLPPVGVFVDRGPRRPNRLGVSRCAIVSVDGRTLRVRGLDAVNGTPVIDLKAVMAAYTPTLTREPAWVQQLMADYFAPEE